MRAPLDYFVSQCYLKRRLILMSCKFELGALTPNGQNVDVDATCENGLSPSVDVGEALSFYTRSPRRLHHTIWMRRTLAPFRKGKFSIEHFGLMGKPCCQINSSCVICCFITPTRKCTDTVPAVADDCCAW